MQRPGEGEEGGEGLLRAGHRRGSLPRRGDRDALRRTTSRPLWSARCPSSSSTPPTRRPPTSRRRSPGWPRGSRPASASRRCSARPAPARPSRWRRRSSEVQRPALVIAHNKTLAAQLCNEFREFFPDNAVEYFVSYYDYYQPEAYVPAQDLYIEKDSSINDEIDRLRHAATAALFARRDVIIVASVSCIYGIGSPQVYNEKMQLFKVGDVDRPRRGPAQAGEDAVPAQRLGPRPRHLPGARRGAGDHARLRRVRLPDLPLRRRDRGRSSTSTR